MRANTILADVRVLAVDQTFKQDKDTKTVIGKTATLELTPAQAEQVAARRRIRARISLSLRPLGATVDSAGGQQSCHGRRRSTAAPVSIIRYGIIARDDADAGREVAVRKPNDSQMHSCSAPCLLAGAAGRGRRDAACRRPRPMKQRARHPCCDRQRPARSTSASRWALDKAAVVELDTDAHDVLVSSPDIVDAVVRRRRRRIFLLATKTGQTNAFFFDARGHQILSLDIRVEKDVTDLAAMMKADLPNSAIKVSAMNDNVVLSGTVSSALESTRAADLAASFTGDPKKVVNMLSIAGGEQVMLKVRIAEMDRNIAKQFGVNLAGAAMIGGVPIVACHRQSLRPCWARRSAIFGRPGRPCLHGAGANPLPAAPAHLPRNNAQGVFKALEQVGLVHMLAEPNLTAVSGETAKFLAGGEFPVPAGQATSRATSRSSSSSSASACPSRRWCCRPAASRLQISTEVSELTNTGAFTLQGGTVAPSTAAPPPPAASPFRRWTVRRAETTVELPSGGSFAIAGLMQHDTKQVIDGFPGPEGHAGAGRAVPQPRFPERRNRTGGAGQRLSGQAHRRSAAGDAHRRLCRADRSGNAAAGPPERGLQKEHRQAADAGGLGSGRLCGAIGE